jgi:hypothetical protein
MNDVRSPMSSEAHGSNVANRPIVQRGASWWTEHAAAADAWERQHEAEWVRVDQKLRGIAARRAALDAEEANLLRYAEELKLWRGWGFGSMLEYMERALGYAPRTAAERLRVARALAELPLVAEALEHGDLAHSAVRELSRVAVPDTEAAWLDAARGKSLREIEAMVSGHKPGHLPTDETEPRLHRKTLTLEVSPETYDIWRKLHALAAEEHGQRLSDDELIPSLFRRAYGGRTGSDGDVGGDGDGSIGASGASGGNGASGGADNAGDVGANTGNGGGKKASSPAYKIAIKQCPDCKRAWQYSGGRDLEVDPAVAECAACDAVHLGSLDAAAPERATTTVTTRKREQVLARDGYCCTVPGCRRNVGLDLHHIEYQSRGGNHDLKNLTTLCDLHHRAVHFGKLVIRGIAPDGVTFEFHKPRDRRNVTDDEAPACAAPGGSPAVALPSPARGASSPNAGLAPLDRAWAQEPPPHVPSTWAHTPPPLHAPPMWAQEPPRSHDSPPRTQDPLLPHAPPTWAQD